MTEEKPGPQPETQWLESVVREWATALREAGFTKEEATQAQHYVDMEYPSEFEYSRAYMALRTFFLISEVTPGADKDDHVLASAGARMLICAEAAYRLGYDDAMKKAKELPDARGQA